MEKVYYTNEQIDSMVEKLYNQVKDSGIKFTSIIAIARGGVPVAEKLNKKLNLPLKQIKISFYKEDKRQDDPIIDMFGETLQETETYLVVDDLVDSGATLDYFQSRFPKANYKYVTLFWNPHGRFNKAPHYYVDMHLDKWIVFPWEIDQV